MENMFTILYASVTGWTLGFVIWLVKSHPLANREIVIDELDNEGSRFLHVGNGTAKAGPINGMEDIVGPPLLVLNVLTKSPSTINVPQKLLHTPSDSTSWKKVVVGPIRSLDRKNGIRMKIGL
jgi:hypothetical protein